MQGHTGSLHPKNSRHHERRPSGFSGSGGAAYPDHDVVTATAPWKLPREYGAKGDLATRGGTSSLYPVYASTSSTSGAFSFSMAWKRRAGIWVAGNLRVEVVAGCLYSPSCRELRDA